MFNIIVLGVCFVSILFTVNLTKLELAFALGTMRTVTHAPLLNWLEEEGIHNKNHRCSSVGKFI